VLFFWFYYIGGLGEHVLCEVMCVSRGANFIELFLRFYY